VTRVTHILSHLKLFRTITRVSLFCLIGFSLSHLHTNPSQATALENRQDLVPAAQRLRMDQIISIFENGTPEIQYAYIENLPDGRGYTAGRAGFTTATGDLLEVVHRYLGIQLNSAFRSVLPILEDRARTQSDSIEGLEILPTLWSAAAQDPLFGKVQDSVVDELYFQPVYQYAKRYKVKTHLGLLCIYDALIQHGGGHDQDGTGAMLARVQPKTDSEKSFLLDFLKVRRAVLLNPYNQATAREWKKSIGRLAALRDLVHSNQFDLDGPINIDVYGGHYRIP